MAEVSTGGGDKGGKNKQKKIHLRVDFTPMVDMNMLLITFFMFCTTLSKPQTMEISMPDKNPTEDPPTVKHATTILLAANNKVYYYFDEPNYDDYKALVETDYTENGLRKMLLEKNARMVEKINALKAQLKAKAIDQKQYDAQEDELRKAKDAPIVIIKPMDDSSYKNMVDALDEMLVCNISKYAVAEFSDADDFLIKNYLSQGHAARGTSD